MEIPEGLEEEQDENGVEYDDEDEEGMLEVDENQLRALVI